MKPVSLTIDNFFERDFIKNINKDAVRPINQLLSKIGEAYKQNSPAESRTSYYLSLLGQYRDGVNAASENIAELTKEDLPYLNWGFHIYNALDPAGKKDLKQFTSGIFTKLSILNEAIKDPYSLLLDIIQINKQEHPKIFTDIEKIVKAPFYGAFLNDFFDSSAGSKEDEQNIKPTGVFMPEPHNIDGMSLGLYSILRGDLDNAKNILHHTLINMPDNHEHKKPLKTILNNYVAATSIFGTLNLLINKAECFEKTGILHYK